MTVYLNYVGRGVLYGVLCYVVYDGVCGMCYSVCVLWCGVCCVRVVCVYYSVCVCGAM